MKILAIRLKNLASLAGEQVIDFTAEPLASAGLFAITGPTGAGKSTILDALCLALFGSTPRLDGASLLSKVPDGHDEIGSGDERNLLRRGCGSGYAEVDFVGVDGRRYRARWEVKRAREKVDGRLQASSQSLLDLDNEQLLASGKKREFKELLEARLGLTLAQFTRAVLLAQSEFSAFLKADDNERGTLLEKLTDTGLYSRLGQASFEAAKRTREALAQLQQQLGGLQPLEAEARQALEALYDEQQSELKAAQQRLKSVEQQRQWRTDLSRLQHERDTAQTQLHEAEAEHETLADARRILALFEQLAPQRHRFIRQSEAQLQLAKVEETLARQQAAGERLQLQFSSLEQSQQQALTQLQAAEQAQRDAEPRLAQARREEDRLLHLQADLAPIHQESAQIQAASSETASRLQQLQERQQHGAQQLEELNSQLQTSAALQPLCAAWNGYRPRLQQAVQLASRLQQGRAELPGLEQRAQLAADEQHKARTALDELQAQLGGEVSEQLSRLNQQLENWRQAERDTEALQSAWIAQQNLLTRQAQLQNEYSRLQSDQEKLIPAGKQARSERDAAEQALKVTLGLLERQRLARSENVETLRAALVPGEPCPVCGSDEHPWHQTDALLAALQQQDESEAERARQALQVQDQRLQELRDHHTEHSAHLKQAQQRLTEIATELDTLLPRLQASALYASLLAQPEAERTPWLAGELDTLKAHINNASQTQTQLLALQQRSVALQGTWQTAQDTAKEAAQHLTQQHEAIARDSQRLEEELADFAELLPSERLRHWRENPAQTFMMLDSEIATRLQQLQAQTELIEEQRQREKELESAQRDQQNLQEKQKACSARLAERESQLEACRQSLRSNLGEQRSASDWQQQLEAALQLAREQQMSLQQQLNDIQLERTRLSSEQQSCTERRDELQRESASLQHELSAWRAAHPQLDDAAFAQLLHMDDSLLDEARQRLQQNAEALTRCRERLEGCTQRLASHQAQYPDAADAEALERHYTEQLASCEQAERSCTETRATLLDDDNRRRQSQALLAEIDTASAEHQRWARIAALIGSSDGGAFRKIAQAYNLDLLVQHANVQLRQLARRYRLKRGGSPLGLLVMDTEMGDELRSVHSLSGGETFLVSLALALGLASMASSKLRIESLFIDEGFGSLDPESLQVAMDALDSLQAQGRKVAVISHVAEMHERIPVQIQVQRQGNGQSGLKIIG